MRFGESRFGPRTAALRGASHIFQRPAGKSAAEIRFLLYCPHIACGFRQVSGGSAVTGSKQPPLVAIVTPVYNGGSIMERTLESVQQQTYPNLVHVILDNASKDETADIIQLFAHRRVPIITRRNEATLPQVANWNAAMAMTPPEAKYVNLLAADDLIRPDCIEKLASLAETDDEIDFVHAIDCFDGKLMPHGLEPGVSVYAGPDYARRFLRNEVSWLSAAHVFFRATPERLQAPYSAELPTILDAEFVVRELLDRKMGFVFEPLFYTRYDHRTQTARSGGYRPSMLALFLLRLKYGPRLFAPDEQSRLIAAEYRKVLRHVLAWRLTGHSPMAERTLAGLAAAGFTPAALDYVGATLSWPSHKFGGTGYRPAPAGGRLSEGDFLPGLSPTGGRTT